MQEPLGKNDNLRGTFLPIVRNLRLLELIGRSHFFDQRTVQVHILSSGRTVLGGVSRLMAISWVKYAAENLRLTFSAGFKKVLSDP